MGSYAVAWLLDVVPEYRQYPVVCRHPVILAFLARHLVHGSGLRLAETCGLRVDDIDSRAVVYPKVQYPSRPLKTKISKTPVPVPASLIGQCSAQISAYGRHETLMTGEDDRQLSPWTIERAMRKAREEAKGPPRGLFADCRGLAVTKPPAG